MILTPAQIQELTKIIENQHLIFIANNVGSGVLTQDDLTILAKHGIDIDSLPKYGVVDDALKFGILADALGSEKAKAMKYDEFKKFVASGEHIPLTAAEKITLEHIRLRMYSDIKSLGNRIGNDVRNIALEKSNQTRAKYEDALKETFTSGVEQSKSASEIALELGHKTKDWARDFDRISDYVLHEAFDTGKALSLLRKGEESGEEQYCIKEVYPGACEHCIRLYLTNGYGSQPRIFKVKTLLANGDNIGVKAADYKPVIGSTHPWCRCELHHLPANNVWDNEQKKFVLRRNTYGVTRKSKIKIVSE